MDRNTFATVAVVLAIALAGCFGGATPATDEQSPMNGSQGDGTTVDESPTGGSPTDGSTPTPASSDGGEMPAAPASLPSTEACLTAGVPPSNVTAGANESMSGRPYPPTPNATTSTEAMGDFAAAFEEAYVYNGKLADESPDDSPLTRVTAQVTRVNVSRLNGGYLVVVDGLGATQNETGVHGDYGISAVYRITVDAIERSPRVEQGEWDFEPVVTC